MPTKITDTRTATIVLLITTFLVKITGLNWGFPAILHNDESNVVRSSLGLRFGDLNPHHFDWPSLYFYINYFFFWIFIKLRTRLQVLFGTQKMQELFPFWWGPELPFYLIGRIITNIFILLSIFLVYKISSEIFKNKKFALLSSILLAIGGWITYVSFYALSDAALMFFILFSFYFSMKITKRSNIKNYIFAAIFAGLATSTKYNGAIICLAIPIAHLLRERNITKIFDWKIFLSALISILFFFIGTPFALLDWKTFSGTSGASGAFWQATHIGYALNWPKHLFEIIPQNFGWLLAIFSLAGIFLLLKSRNTDKKFTAVAFLLFFLHIGSWGIARAHYSLPYLPFLAISGTYAIKKFSERYKLSKTKFILVVMILIIFPLTASTKEIIKRNREDTRLLAGRWVEQSIPEGSYIQLSKERTGFFGGDMPVFDYSKYTISVSKLPIPDQGSFEKRYLIETSTINCETESCQLIYEQSNSLRTGPKIFIYVELIQHQSGQDKFPELL